MHEHRLKIGEVSELFHIPRSTLRFWEEKGLIQSQRNSANDYRQYSLQTFFEICDIFLFRSLGVPVRNLNNFQTMTTADLEHILSNSEKNIDRQIQDLQVKKERVLAQINKIKELERLRSDSFRTGVPDIVKLVSESIISRESMENFMDDPSQACIVFKNPPEAVFELAMAVPEESGGGNIVWSRPVARPHERTQLYLECLVRVSLETAGDTNISDICRQVARRGYRPGKLVGRYLVTAFDQTRNDYYQGWIEVN